MNKKTYTLNTLLAVVLGAALLVCVLVRTFAPRMILPQLDIPNLVLISLIALVADHYLAPGAKRCWICIPLLGGLTFGLLPFAACFVAAGEAFLLGVKGAAVFSAVAWMFTSAQDRLSTGPDCKAAPAVTAFGIYLAAQCFMGILA